MLALIFECGSVTSSWYAELALRRRVKKSAIGSVIVMTGLLPSSRWFPGQGLPRTFSGRGDVVAVYYQLLFDTPGSSPACAISRRQILHSPNLRKTACGRPHLLQRV